MTQSLGDQEHFDAYQCEAFEGVHAADLTGGHHVSCDVRLAHSHIHVALYQVL